MLVFISDKKPPTLTYKKFCIFNHNIGESQQKLQKINRVREERRRPCDRRKIKEEEEKEEEEENNKEVKTDICWVGFCFIQKGRRLVKIKTSNFSFWLSQLELQSKLGVSQALVVLY